LGKSSEYILARKPTNSTGVRRCTRPWIFQLFCSWWRNNLADLEGSLMCRRGPDPVSWLLDNSGK
jgi:hypothetical protein